MSAHDFASSPPLRATRLARMRANRWAALPVVLAGTFMVVLDFFIVNVAMAALLSPQVLSIIGVAYTGPDRVRALSVYGIVLGLAAVSGQLIGGVLVQADVAGLGWRSSFLINVPIGALALALVAHLVPESRAERSSRLDVTGTVLVTAGLTAILLPLVEGRQHGCPLWT